MESLKIFFFAPTLPPSPLCPSPIKSLEHVFVSAESRREKVFNNAKSDDAAYFSILHMLSRAMTRKLARNFHIDWGHDKPRARAIFSSIKLMVPAIGKIFCHFHK